MPFIVKKSNQGQYCVHKMDEKTGMAMGSSIECFDTITKANDAMLKMRAQEKEMMGGKGMMK